MTKAQWQCDMQAALDGEFLGLAADAETMRRVKAMATDHMLAAIDRGDLGPRATSFVAQDADDPHSWTVTVVEPPPPLFLTCSLP